MLKKQLHKVLFFCIVFFQATLLGELDDAHKKLFEQLCVYKGPKDIFMSYPRSGNTWLRYCIEFLTGRPTFHRYNLKHNINQPLAWLAGFDVDCNKPPIEKIHTQKELEKSGCNKEMDKIVLIIRNPKEALSRHGGMEITLPVLEGSESKGNADPRIYFNNIGVYDSWNPHNRLLIYYEDLITKPIETLVRLLIFLNESFDKIDRFMQDYDAHKQMAISLYKASESEGNDLLYHSKMISPSHRKQIDTWIGELHPYLWKTYLQSRYAEENLIY